MKWISVEDRLPKFHTDVLLFVKTEREKSIFSGYLISSELDHMNHNDFVIYLPSVKIQDKSVHINLSFTHWHICKQDKFNKVMYWMPLPEPPK